MKITLQGLVIHGRCVGEHQDEAGNTIVDEFVVDGFEMPPPPEAEKVRRDAVDFVVRLAETVHMDHHASDTLGWRICPEDACRAMIRFVERMAPK